MKDILTFLGLDYREASLITLYYVVLGITTQMNRLLNNMKIIVKKVKWTYWFSGNDYRVAKLSKLYLTVIGIIMQSLKWIGQLNFSKLAKS